MTVQCAMTVIHRTITVQWISMTVPQTNTVCYYASKSDIFHRRFHCVQRSTRPINRDLFSGIFKDPLDAKPKIFKKKTKFVNFMFHVKILVFL